MPEDDETNLVSSTSIEDNNIVIVEESWDPHSTAGILNVCKRKLLGPYLRFLGLVGLRPLVQEIPQSKPIKCCNSFYNFQVVVFLLIGYFLQYNSCFRRDRGFAIHPNRTEPLMTSAYEETCTNSWLTSFALPSILHFVGYVSALILFRRGDDNQLPVLIERVFLASSHIPNLLVNQQKIVKILWIFIIISSIWLITSIAIVNYMMAEGEVNFTWLEHSSIVLKVLLILCIIWQDIVEVSVICNYCLQAELLRKYVQFVRAKLLQQSLHHPLEWIRDIEEFKKLLQYFNEQMAPSVCVFTILNWSYALAGILWLWTVEYQYDIVPFYTVVSFVNILLWWCIAIIPFIQAARLTNCCLNLKTVGQEIRIRPFAHQDTPIQELNFILIYTSSLRMSAKLFRLPINGKYMGIIFGLLCIISLVVGQTNLF